VTLKLRKRPLNHAIEFFYKAVRVWLGCWVDETPGKQSFEVFDGFCQRQLTEQLHQIGVRFDAVSLAGFDQRVEISAGLGAGHCVAKQPVAAAHHEGANGIFAEIVIDGPSAMVDKANQFGPLRRQVMQGLAQQTAGRNPVQMLYQQAFDLGQNRSALFLALLSALFGAEFFRFGFDGIQLAYRRNKLRRQ